MSLSKTWRALAAAAASLAFAAFAETEVTFYYPVAVGGPITKTIDQMSADFEMRTPASR